VVGVGVGGVGGRMRTEEGFEVEHRVGRTRSWMQIQRVKIDERRRTTVWMTASASRVGRILPASRTLKVGLAIRGFRVGRQTQRFPGGRRAQGSLEGWGCTETG